MYLFNVRKNNILVIPVPTAASVMARSGASKNIHTTDITTLYAINIITALKSLFVTETSTAHTIKNKK